MINLAMPTYVVNNQFLCSAAQVPFVVADLTANLSPTDLKQKMRITQQQAEALSYSGLYSMELIQTWCMTTDVLDHLRSYVLINNCILAPYHKVADIQEAQKTSPPINQKVQQIKHYRTELAPMGLKLAKRIAEYPATVITVPVMLY